MPRLDPATRNIAIDRHQAGESQNEVARTLNVNHSTIYRLWNRFQQAGSTNNRQRSGWPRITTPGQDRYIRIFHLPNRIVAASTTAAGIPGLRRISSQIVHNRLQQHDIRPRRPYFGAILTPLHRRTRIRRWNRLRSGNSETGEECGLATSLVFCCRNVVVAYVYIDAEMNVFLPPVFWKWIASVKVVSWCGQLSQVTAK